jgi:predicted permease
VTSATPEGGGTAGTDVRALAVGAAAGLAIALPAALLAQVADATSSGDDPPAVVLPLFLVTLTGLGVAGFVAASKRPDAPLRHGSLAALAAFVLVQGLGIARNLVAGNDVSIAAALFNATVATGLGVLGGYVAERRSR